MPAGDDITALGFSCTRSLASDVPLREKSIRHAGTPIALHHGILQSPEAPRAEQERNKETCDVFCRDKAQGRTDAPEQAQEQVEG